MRRNYIEGINGSFEIRNRYIIATIGNNEKKLLKEHIVLFEEIENVKYKKPSKDKYGYITIYLSTKNYLTKEKIYYSLILDKVDEKSMDTYKKIYIFISEIVNCNKDIKIVEIKNINEEEDNNELNHNLNEITNNENNEVIVNVSDDKKMYSVKTTSNDKNINKTNNDTINEKINENEVNQTITKENIIEIHNDINKENKDELEIIKTYKDYQEELELEFIEEDYIDNNTNDINKINEFEKLEKKLLNLEKELVELSYKEVILNKYVDETKERNEIDKLIIRIKNIIEELTKIKKELLQSEKNINENNYIKVNNGNVIITSISDKLKNNLNNSYDVINIYRDVTNEILKIEKETELLSNNADYKKDEIKISDEEYEKEINILNNVENEKELIIKKRYELEENVKKIKKKIETTIEPQKKYKFVKKGIQDITKNMAILTTINQLRPNHSRFSTYMFALSTGLLAIHDILGYDIKEVNYNEIVTKESIIGLDLVDTGSIRIMLEKSKDDVEKILYDCKLKYRDYPKFEELYNSINEMKNDLEKESIELKKIEDKIDKYKNEEKVKILRYREE